MTIKEYKNVRNKAKDLSSKILDIKNSERNELIYAAKLLGFWNGNSMIFDSEDESDIMLDFLIYERNKQGVKCIDKFYDSDIKLDDLEEDILEGMVNYHSSLFEIQDINKDNAILTLIDLFDKNHKEFKLIDVGLSQTSTIGLLIYSRLLPIQDFSITSGMSFGFAPSVIDRILSDISNAQFKKRRMLNSTDLFVLCHQKNKQYGLNIVKK